MGWSFSGGFLFSKGQSPRLTKNSTSGSRTWKCFMIIITVATVWSHICTDDDDDNQHALHQLCLNVSSLIHQHIQTLKSKCVSGRLSDGWVNVNTDYLSGERQQDGIHKDSKPDMFPKCPHVDLKTTETHYRKQLLTNPRLPSQVIDYTAAQDYRSQWQLSRYCNDTVTSVFH